MQIIKINQKIEESLSTRMMELSILFLKLNKLVLFY